MGEEVIKIVSILALVFMVLVVSRDTSADCRRDALDSMCKTYGYSTGGAVDVWFSNEDGASGFFVKCDNAIGDRVNLSNFSGMFNVTS